MKFKKLIINNLRQFKNINEIEFSTDSEKNITVIYGGITYGKTTLLQAFNWVLYNQLNLQNPSQLLNLEVEDEMKPGDSTSVSAELYLEKEDNDDDGNEYRFKRVQNYYTNLDGQVIPTSSFAIVEKKINDTWEKAGTFEDEVNKILPQNLSTYFFFDGERMDAISKEQRKGSQEVGNSVKSILGLEHFNTAIKHLKGSTGSRVSVISELRNKLNSSAGNDLEELKINIEKYDDDIASAKRRIEEYDIEVDKLETSREAKQKIIADNKDTYKKQQEKSELQHRLDRLETNKERLYQSYINYFNNYYLDFFYYGLKEKLKKLYESNILNQTSEAVPDMHQKSIEYLINRGYCLCGEKIIENDEHYKALIEEMKKLPPQSIGTAISTFKKDVKGNISELKAQNFKTEIINRYSSVDDNYKEINELKDKIDSLSKEIETNVDVGGLEREVREIENRIKSLSMKRGMEQFSIEKLEQSKENTENKINKLAQFDEKNKEILKQIDYANHIIDILQRNYNIRERELIFKLEKEINKYLQRIYIGNRKMKITSDYKFKLVYDENDTIDSSESEGLGIVKAIAFMCGLLEVAKSKILEEVEEETMYPLVLDAPLSNIDSIHRKNVMECLPEVASQVIVFTREKKDLEDISEETKEKDSKEYFIDKTTEKYSKISTERREN